MQDPPEPRQFEPSGFFALRTPLLPFDELLTWGEGLAAPSAVNDPARLEEALASDRARLRARLRDLVSRPEIREALFVASPDLDARLDACLREPDSEAGQKMERALVRYFARMAGRPTPFGLFAGCSVGTIGAATRLTLAGRSQYRRHTRLDMDYVVALAQALARESAVQPHLAVFPNSSLYATPGRICYAEVRRNGKGWTHHKVALASSAYLEATLERARLGALPGMLAAGLTGSDPEAGADEAGEFIADLIDNQVLVPELVPPLTGPEPIHDMIARLRGHGGAIAGEVLEQTRAALAGLDAAGIGASPGDYRDLARRLEALPAKVEPARLLQVDMVKPVVEATLGTDVVDEILSGVRLLQRLARRPRKDVLAGFRERFIARYEGREVPLVEALDHEFGIGFDGASNGEMDSSSLLEGLTFPTAPDETTEWGKREVTLLRKLSQALTSGAREMELQLRDIEEMSHPDPLPLPDAFGAMGTLAATSAEALARGNFRVLLGTAAGPSGARLLGRFCHADPQLAAHVESHLRAEDALHPQAIFAEVVHLPESRMGNVLARPVLRAYEIPYLGRPGVAVDRQIPATDLRVSVVGNEIVLRSARLDRRVIPRLTSAHNYHMGTGIYKFLCLLQGHGIAEGLTWDWGPLRDAPELPRVVCGRLILARASWRLCRDELQAIGQAKGAARFSALQELRAARRLPRWVSLSDGDNELPVDLDNVLAVETLIELVKSRDLAALTELFPAAEELLASGPEGRFVHEFVVPFVRAAPAERGASTDRTIRDAGPARALPTSHSGRGNGARIVPAATVGRRSFPPGSEWLHAKFYCGQAMADRVLREVIRPVAEKAQQSGAADRWFFIRYGDPDWHVRVRFQGEPARLQAAVLPALEAAAAPFIEDGRIWRVQLDTYEREIERYGGAVGIGLAEQIFHADSIAALALLSIADDARADLRWQIAVCGIDRLLTDLGLDLTARHAVMKKTARAFATEFHTDANLQKQINEKYRTGRKGLERLLDPAIDSTGLPSSVGPILRRRSAQLAPAVEQLKNLNQGGRLARPIVELASSFVHMHVNRLLPSAHRAQELVLYDFLRRLYESQLARSLFHQRQDS
jgi:thiopeptide-type bacteriocin biosynthesis protein